MKKLGIAGLLFALLLALASCGGAGSTGAGDTAGRQASESTAETTRAAEETTGGGMAGMDQSEMDHGSMGSEEMARQMLVDANGEYSDERFIDAMVPHHQGAVEMAEVALQNAEHEEIKELSRDIVRTQEAEIEELKDIKREEFGTSEVPMEMSDRDMEMMGMMDPQRLAEQRPFDRAFIDAMIPHHRSAIDMANVALENTDNPRIRRLANDIVEAQTREIQQLNRWREQWYPRG